MISLFRIERIDIKYDVFIYFILSSVCVLLFSFLVPPFCVQDEPHHFFRAVQISQGDLVAKKYNQEFSGGEIPEGLVNFSNSYLNWAFDPNERGGIEKIHHDINQNYSNKKIPVNFSNTAIYPPIFYTFSSLSYYLAQKFGYTELKSFYFGRIINGLFCVAVCALSLTLCSEAAKLWLLLCLCIPENYQLFASFSQDGVSISFLLLSLALMSNFRKFKNKNLIIILSTLFLSFFVMSKPPYFPFLFIPFVLYNKKYMKQTIAALFVAFFMVFLWCFYGVLPASAATNPADHPSALGQINNMINHPLFILKVLWNTFAPFPFGQSGDYLFRTFLATLAWGWMVEHLKFYYGIFLAFIFLIFFWYIMKIIFTSENSGRLSAILIFVIAILSGLGATFATYLTWSPVGAMRAVGTNGRYFIPCFCTLLACSEYITVNAKEKCIILKIQNYFFPLFFIFSNFVFLYSIYIRFWWPISSP